MRVLAHLININAAFRQSRFVDCFSAFYGGTRLEYDFDGEAGGVSTALNEMDLTDRERITID